MAPGEVTKSETASTYNLRRPQGCFSSVHTLCVRIDLNNEKNWRRACRKDARRERWIRRRSDARSTAVASVYNRIRHVGVAPGRAPCACAQPFVPVGPPRSPSNTSRLRSARYPTTTAGTTTPTHPARTLRRTHGEAPASVSCAIRRRCSRNWTSSTCACSGRA